MEVENTSLFSPKKQCTFHTQNTTHQNKKTRKTKIKTKHKMRILKRHLNQKKSIENSNDNSLTPTPIIRILQNKSPICLIITTRNNILSISISCDPVFLSNGEFTDLPSPNACLSNNSIPYMQQL